MIENFKYDASLIWENTVTKEQKAEIFKEQKKNVIDAPLTEVQLFFINDNLKQIWDTVKSSFSLTPHINDYLIECNSHKVAGSETEIHRQKMESVIRQEIAKAGWKIEKSTLPEHENRYYRLF